MQPKSPRLETLSGSKRPATQQDIADICGVSRVTVSRVLSGDTTHTSEEVFYQILQTAQDLNYNPEVFHAARRMAFHRAGKQLPSKTIGLYFPRTFCGECYFTRILEGLLDVFNAHAYAVLLDYLPEEETPLSPLFTRGDVDGVIAIGRMSYLYALHRRLRREPYFADQPFITLIEVIPGNPSIITDDFLGGYAAANHLLELGHRRILHFAHESDEYPHRLRLSGYRQACRQQHLDPAEVLSYRYIGTFKLAEYVAAEISGFFAEHPEVTAVLARNDEGARLFSGIFAQLGKCVPEEISLIGYDDTAPVYDRHGRNALTTIAVPLNDIGQRAARLMLQLLDGAIAPTEPIILPTELIIRSTTAVPPR